MKAKRTLTVEPPVEGEGSERHGPEYIADLVWSEELFQRRMGHLRIVHNVDLIVHCEFVSQRVAIYQRDDCKQQSDTQGILHVRRTNRICHARILIPTPKIPRKRNQ